MIATLTLASVVAFVAGRRCQRSQCGGAVVAASLLACLAYSWLLQHHVVWIRWLPRTDLDFATNLSPIGVALAAGCLWPVQAAASTQRATASLTRIWMPAGLLMTAAALVVAPVSATLIDPIDPDDLQSRWSDSVCLQSHASTCAPAAVATLLRHRGIDREESDLVSICRTSNRGTRTFGVHRGLQASVSGSAQRVGLSDRDPNQWATLDQLPSIALVRFPSSHSRHAMLRKWLGPRSEGHAVVVVDRTDDGAWIIADPAVGPLQWSDEEFRGRFSGVAMHLTSAR